MEDRTNQESMFREFQQGLSGMVETYVEHRNRPFRTRDYGFYRLAEGMNDDLETQLRPDNRQQRSINRNCRTYASRFERTVAYAVNLTHHHYRQRILPEEARQANSGSAIQALRELAGRPITLELAIDDFPEHRQELERIRNTYLF